jgi:hypothetical protein
MCSHLLDFCSLHPDDVVGDLFGSMQAFDQAQYNLLERSRVELEYDVVYKVTDDSMTYQYDPLLTLCLYV